MADKKTGETTGRNVDSDLELHLAIAVYFCTYADGNVSTRQYYDGLAQDA